MKIMGKYSGNSVKKEKTDTEIMDKLYPLINEEDLERYAKFFKHDLIAALHNQRSSLSAILNPVYKITPKPSKGVAIAIGGTYGYVSYFTISKKKDIKFYNRKIFQLPQYVKKEELFRIISKYVFEAAGGKRTLPIGISFAYPLKPVLMGKYIDGELLYMTKERNIEGLIGKRVGQEYHKFLIKEYDIDTEITVANDTISLLLGGEGAEIAGVIGTGLNFAYWEKRTNIAPLKLGELHNFVQGDIAINTESKNFDKITETPLRKKVDEMSESPGLSLSEKEAAGAYLYKIFNAGKNDILGKDFPALTSSDQINDIISNAYIYPANIDIQTKAKAKFFAERIYHRSAQIVAVEICGILFKLGKTTGIIPIIIDGGIFWKAKNYPALVNLYINMILPQVIPSFTRLFGSSRRGIAILTSGI